MTAYLIAEEGPLTGLIIALEEGTEWILGRDPEESTVLLEDPMVSRKHALCKKTATGYLFENLSATNPIIHNGAPLEEPVLLLEGDSLQIGSSLFHFTEHKPGTEEPSTDALEYPDFFEEPQGLSEVRLESSESARWMLKVISGPNAGAEFRMNPDAAYILGKDPHLCDIVFQDLSVSRQHARISIDAENLLSIEDLESRNGVLVNGETIQEKTPISSQDLIALGTTSFLLIDQSQPEETIIAAPPAALPKPEELAEVSAESSSVEEMLALPPRDWKETVISTRMLITGGLLAVALLAGVGLILALFHSQPVVVEATHPEAEVKAALHGFPDVQFSFNPSNGRLFLLGHVLTPIDKQELLYKVHNLPFITYIEDTVVVDEYVWQNMNGLLQSNTGWQGVALHSTTPGRFIIKGYLQTSEEAQALSDYLNLNFPYLDRLENQIVVETNLQLQIGGMILEKGFGGVTFQLNNGDLVLSGRVDQKQTASFTGMVETFKALNGIRSVKNFVIYTSSDTSSIDISQKYQVSGYSKTENETTFVVINGRILGIGDPLDGMVITLILPNGVLLEKDGIKFRINYNLQ